MRTFVRPHIKQDSLDFFLYTRYSWFYVIGKGRGKKISPGEIHTESRTSEVIDLLIQELKLR